MSTTIKFLSPKFHAGSLLAAGATLTTDAATAAMYVSDGCAEYIQREALAQDKGEPVFASKSVTGGIAKIWTGTQAQYDAIATKATDTLYVIVAG